MLKDYYKIFGVKEDASEQEIRARWIELMRHYHPDVQKGMEFDEISKEINEAYQILKDPFSRADYDHNLAQHRYYGGKKVSHRLGFIFLGSILFIAIIYMVITPIKPFIPSVSQPIRRNIAPPQIENKVPDVIVEAPRIQRPNEADKQANPINPSNQAKAKVEVQKNPINQTDQRNPINQIKAEAKVKENPTKPSNQVMVEENQTNLTNQTNKINRAEVKVEKSPINPSNPSNPTNPSNSSNQVKVEDKVKVENNQTNQTDQRTPVTQAKAEAKSKDKVDLVKNRPTPIKPVTQLEVKAEVKKNQTNQINQIDQRNQKDQINKTDQRNQISSSIAKDEEIKKFLANYVDRYNRRDINGFMSFFSNRAIQNQKDGLEGIKKIYFTFFNQSLQIRYRLSDLKIEIYQNGINASAQYELDQLARNGRRNVFKGRVRWVLAREGGGLKIVSLDYQQTKGESHEI
jgi:curved DNA-binding protein CbpA/ketosteroid isomerase-like protein